MSHLVPVCRYLPALLFLFQAWAAMAGSLPTVTIVASDASASEVGLDPGTFTLSRVGASTASSLSVSYSFGGSTAFNGTDYVGIGAPLTIPAGEASVEIAITPIADNRAEGTEAVTITLLSSSSYVLGDPVSATINIEDDPAIVTLVATDPDASELGPDPGAFTLSREGGNTDAALNVSYSFGGATAINGEDYVGIGAPLTIPAGETSAVIDIVPVADNRAEGPELVTITLLSSESYVLGDPVSATVTIADDSAVVTLEATDPDASELGPDPGAFTLSRIGGNTDASLNVSYSFGGSTALNGGDYVAIGAPLTIPAGETSTVIDIVPVADNQAEGPELVTITLLSSESYVLGDPVSATVTIADDSAVVTIEATDASATEENLDPGFFTLTRTGGNITAALNVAYSFGGSTATNGSDFVGVGAPFTIPAGELSTEIEIVPVDDDQEEGTELVVISLTSSSSYLVGNPDTATVEIRDVPDLIFEDDFEFADEIKRCALSRSKLENDMNLLELGDATVLDLDTGLHWSLCWIGQSANAYDGTCSGKPVRKVEAGGEMDLAGYFDWRLPSREEMEDFTVKSCGKTSATLPSRAVREF